MASFFSNHLYYHYLGNNYIDFDTYSLLCYGVFGCFMIRLIPQLHRMQSSVIDFTLVIFTVFIIQLATNAVQFTPFPTIDVWLAAHEEFNLPRAMVWTRSHARLEQSLSLIYNSLYQAMMFIPLFLIFKKQRAAIHDYCRYMIFTVAIGFTIYYFFPSCGPAHIYPDSLFYTVQVENHLKFWQIHHGQIPSTINGGLIAFPSFHVLWAWGCVRSLYPFKRLYIIAILWFMLLCISCFNLGWHFSVDILGSLVVILLAELILQPFKLKLRGEKGFSLMTESPVN